MRADRCRRGFVGAQRLAAQRLLQEACVVAVEQRADEPAVEIRRTEQPIGDRKGQVHIDLHHQPRVVMRGVMAPQSIDERAVPHKGVSRRRDSRNA